MTARRIAYLGPAGTFSEEAALKYAGVTSELLPFPTFQAVIEAAETGLADEAVVPIENSLEGSVTGTVDLLIHDTALSIRGELVLPVRHFLIAKPGTHVAAVKTVITHPQPLGQCRRFLDQCLPHAQIVAALSTATAVKDTLASEGCTTVAIGTRRAAELYGGEILASDIQDNDRNVTRFVILGHGDARPSGRDKTSLCFTLQGARQAGTLYASLACFAEAGISLTKLESRPTKEELGYYVFLIDLEGHRNDEGVRVALERLRPLTELLKIFGSYPRYDNGQTTSARG